MNISTFQRHMVTTVAALAVLTLLDGGAVFAQKSAPVPATERNAEIAIERGNVASALAIYSKLISQKPKRFALYLMRGIAYCQTRQYDKAALDFSSFIKLRPALAEGYVSRAYAYERAGRYKEALADLEMVECLDPSRVDRPLRERLRGTVSP